jgi:hypothetical protein
MTGCALRKGNTIKLLHGFAVALLGFVALGAGDLCVFAFELEVGSGVIKPRGWLESIVGMALCAVVFEGALMRVLVAGGAILTQTKIGIWQLFQVLILH